MASGRACSRRLARHVYQAGSRVGATSVGWMRKTQPYAGRAPPAASSHSHGLARGLRSRTGCRHPGPVGYDTAKYVWRANLVDAEGTPALAGSAQSPLHVNADRPGYPVLIALLHAVTRVRPFDLTFVLPAVVASVIGLGAGAFALRVLREPPWAFAVYTIVVGASVNVALVAIGYADTLLAAAVLLAAATATVLA